jgi:hypothetical protein
MPTVLPVGSDVDVAVSRAVAARRERHRPYIFLHDLDERLLDAVVVGMPAPLSRGKDGWWLVGYVLDGIAGETFEVWLSSGCRNLSTTGVAAVIHDKRG